jgi:hypothetical protein
LPLFSSRLCPGGFPKSHFSWAATPRNDIRNISRDLGRAFEKMFIGGLSAPLMVKGNRHMGKGYDYDIHERRDFLDKYKITPLLSSLIKEK